MIGNFQELTVSQLVGSRYLIAEKAIEQLVEPCRDNLAAENAQIQYYDNDLVNFGPDTTPVPASRTAGIQATDLRQLIYTSGTTGLPKSTVITAGRWINTARAMA